MSPDARIAYVVSHLDGSNAFEWTARALNERFDFVLVMLNPKEGSTEKTLRSEGVSVISILYRGKRDLPRVILTLVSVFRSWRPTAIHCHLLDACLAGLLAGWIARIPRRIYTRHTSTYHHVYAKSGVWYDKLCNRLSTRIVSLSQATDYALEELEGVNRSKIIRIPHGFRFEAFADPSADRIKTVKARWSIPDRGPRIGIVARHIEWKGIEYIISAFRKFLPKSPDAVLILANSFGPDHDRIMGLLEGMPTGSVVHISFEEDFGALFHQFDMYVHTPVDRYCEAFGQTYVEALACGIPSVFTRSGIAHEFVQHEIHALVVDFRNSGAVENAIERLWKDQPLRERLSLNGKAYVEHHFGFNLMIEKLIPLYHE